MEQNTDDLFASLGGSLMKDLWDDLQIGEDDLKADGMGWSLEQLERELAHLDDTAPPDAGMPPSSTTSFPAGAQPPPPGLSAASLVVSHAQEKQQQFATPPPPQTTNAADAWSQSLQKFTALSLEKDFLAADSARKQQKSSTAPPGIAAPPTNLTFSEEYDVSEQVQLMAPGSGAPPPGLGGSPMVPPPTAAGARPPPGLKSTPAAKEPATMPQQEQTKTKAAPPKPKPAPPTPYNSFASQSESSSAASQQQQQPPQLKQTPPPKQPQPSMILQRPPMQQPPPPQMMQPQQPPPVMMQHPPMQQQPPPPGPVPPRAGGMAWQSPPPQPQAPPPTMRVYCQSHPSAPPFPATVLESSYMKARDISYVLHSMLKPVLLMGVSSSDYHVELLSKYHKQQSVQTPGGASKKGDQGTITTASSTVSIKSKEWMEKHSTLGHVSRTDVTRPRALIAATTLTKEQLDDDEGNKKQQQRATLLKSRLYIDQAYQAYVNIVRIWKANTAGGSRPPAQEIQPHLLRLYKYFGIQSKEDSTTVDPKVLGIILKLSKGKILISRILEQALLPPHVVQALLPVLFELLLPQLPNKELTSVNAENRLFGACAQVLTMLPTMESGTIVSCLQQFLKNSKLALETTFRMECIHALLQRGGAMAAKDPTFAAKEWNPLEQEFLSLLSSSTSTS